MRRGTRRMAASGAAKRLAQEGGRTFVLAGLAQDIGPLAEGERMRPGFAEPRASSTARS